jgi:hypothetical protein
MVISVDFDGTCVTHEFPKTGKDIGAEIVLRKLAKKGYDIICLSMRSSEHKEDFGIDTIQAIKDWFSSHDIPLYAVNHNPCQEMWSKSRKVYANLYIDDQFLGCPLKKNQKYSDRNFVDWFSGNGYLFRYELITKEEMDEIKNELKEKYGHLYY